MKGSPTRRSFLRSPAFLEAVQPANQLHGPALVSSLLLLSPLPITVLPPGLLAQLCLPNLQSLKTHNHLQRDVGLPRLGEVVSLRLFEVGHVQNGRGMGGEGRRVEGDSDLVRRGEVRQKKTDLESGGKKKVKEPVNLTQTDL